MTDDLGAAAPLAAEDPGASPTAPVEWRARAPDVAWGTEALVLEPAFVERSAIEPGILTLSAAGWQVCGASVRGKAHAHRGEFRDDAMASRSDGELLVLAVADGAGSSALSRVGAAVVAELVGTRTVERFRAAEAGASVATRLGTAMAHAVHDAAMRLHELAAMADLAPSAFRTTLVLVATIGDLMLVTQVGDGAVLIERTDGSVSRVGAMRETAWAGEVTCFVPDPCAMTQAAALRQLPVSEVAMVALMTDGVDDPFHPLEQSGGALVAQWRRGTAASIGSAVQPVTGPVLGDIDALQRWLAFEQRGEVDDRTLLLAWRSDGALT